MTDSALHDLSLSADTQALLDRYGFSQETFEALRARLRRGVSGDEQNRIRGRVEAPRADEVFTLPAPGTEARARLTALGTEAIRQGRVAAVVLAGGMATRFGGVVKAAVEVAEGKTFLDLKLADIRASARRAQGRIPTYLMTSFATDAEVRRMAEAVSTKEMPVSAFAQFISLRLTPEGELFRDGRGEVSPYAPGHGDLPFALARAGLIGKLRESGVTMIYMSNVDNLAATLEPAVIGAHLESKRAISVEVADKAKGDKGGAPARVDGLLQIVEGFRFPKEFDQDSIPVFNTNTFVIDVDALDRPFELSWFAVSKEVDGKKAIQFERLVGELTAFLPSAAVAVAREGDDGRFMPVKDPPELEARRAAIVGLLEKRGAL
jgi:UTP--glucose-1-phosphate uridylyltransferase